MIPPITMTTRQVRENIGKIMTPGTYKLREIMCDDCGYPSEPSMRRLRGKQ